jgi:hypothetical protein
MMEQLMKKAAIDRIKPADLARIGMRIEDCLCSAKSQTAKRLLYRTGMKVKEAMIRQPGVFKKIAGFFGYGQQGEQQ